MKDFFKTAHVNVLFGFLGECWICLNSTGFNEEEENHLVLGWVGVECVAGCGSSGKFEACANIRLI